MFIFKEKDVEALAKDIIWTKAEKFDENEDNHLSRKELLDHSAGYKELIEEAFKKSMAECDEKDFGEDS